MILSQFDGLIHHYIFFQISSKENKLEIVCCFDEACKILGFLKYLSGFWARLWRMEATDVTISSLKKNFSCTCMLYSSLCQTPGDFRIKDVAQTYVLLLVFYNFVFANNVWTVELVTVTFLASQKDIAVIERKRQVNVAEKDVDYSCWF